jgi:tetratricopeptide (TPR) repeat protein
MAKVVALGGDGEDWLALGVTQLAQEKLDKAEGTLRGAQNLLKDSPFPSLHLAKLYKEKKDQKAERESVERAIQIDNNSVDAWAYLTAMLKEQQRRRRRRSEVEELANAPVNAKCGAVHRAPGVLRGTPRTRRRATRPSAFAKKAVERGAGDALALLCLSALYGQRARSTRW